MSYTRPGNVPARLVPRLRIGVPKYDWSELTRGHKTEFRKNGMAKFVQNEELPLPCVLYRQEDHSVRQVAVVLSSWVEPLGAITLESIQREGCEDLAEFRKWWVEVTRRPWRPQSQFRAYVVRMLHEGDREEMGGRLFDLLYGEFT